MKMINKLLPLISLSVAAVPAVSLITSCSGDNTDKEATVTYIGGDTSFSVTSTSDTVSGKEILYFKTDSEARTTLDDVKFSILENDSPKMTISVSNFAWDSFKKGTFHCELSWSYSFGSSTTGSKYSSFYVRVQYFNTEKLSACTDSKFSFSVSATKESK